MLGISLQSVVRKRGDVTSPFHHCPIEAIIFDLDGTLLDSAAQIAAAINALLRARGLETFLAGEIARHVGWGVAETNQIGVRLAPGRDQSDRGLGRTRTEAWNLHQ